MKDLVIKPSAPYYIDVYSLIRRHKKKAGKWSDKNEQNYLLAKNQKTKPSGKIQRIKSPDSIKLSLNQFKTLEDIFEKDSYLVLVKSNKQGGTPHYEQNNYIGKKYRVDTVDFLIGMGLAKIVIAVDTPEKRRICITKAGRTYLEHELESRCKK